MKPLRKYTLMVEMTCLTRVCKMKENWMSRLDDDFNKLAKEMDKKKQVIKLPTPSLNWALGNGGLVEGKLAVMYGPESGGKSLLGILTLIEIQKKYPKGYCLLFDAEFSFNKEWFIKLGGDPNRLIVRQTNDPVQIFDYWYGDLKALLQDGLPLKGIMLDSVRSIVYPKDIKEVSTKQIQGGTGAAYLPNVLKQIVPIIREFGITTIFIQQVSDEMDMYKKLANPYVIPDGRALKHNADYFIEVTKIETKEGKVVSGKNMIGADNQIGHKVRMKVKKNRTGAPYRPAEFTLIYEQGISNISDEIFALAKSLDIINHPAGVSNQMWQFGSYEPIRGEDKMKVFVKDNPKIQQEILDACENVSEAQVKKRTEILEKEFSSIKTDLDDVSVSLEEIDAQ